MTPDLVIKGGLVVDPTNRRRGEVRDVWVSGGKIIDPPASPEASAYRTLDARGYVVMPGGVDVHCHIAGSKVNAARALSPGAGRGLEMGRHRTKETTPTALRTGLLYAGLGYTTAVDAAIPPIAARQAHHEFRDTSLIDKAFLALMGNNHLLMETIREDDPVATRNVVAWMLGAVKGFGVKVVNPGGVERWKGGAGNVANLDDTVQPFAITPRQIMTGLGRAVDELKLPHPIHLHGLNLGIPGNAQTTAETLRAMDGHRVHLAHVQFHSYGEAEAKTGLFDSAVAELAELVNTTKGVSVDVGQVMFGETMSMTADGAVGHFLSRLTGRKWVNVDIENETGCGVVPITYSDKNLVHGLQWAVGLEWFLRVTDPWKVAMSTDHPNGGSFLSYPRILALLMDRGLRNDVWKTLPEGVRKLCALGELTREYTYEEVAIITRAGPARMLGLKDKGHLGPGADADLTIYSPDDDKERMFSMPRYVIKTGEVVVEAGEVRASTLGRTLHVEPAYDTAIAPRIRGWIDREYTIRSGNYPVGPDEVSNPLICPCEGPGT